MEMAYVMVAIAVTGSEGHSYNYIWGTYIRAAASHLNHAGFSTHQI